MFCVKVKIKKISFQKNEFLRYFVSDGVYALQRDRNPLELWARSSFNKLIINN